MIIKIIALAVSVLFIHQQILWAQGGEPIMQLKTQSAMMQETVSDDELEVPHNLARKSDVYINGGQEKVIHIQDAHASLSAQYSIVELLDSLVTNYDLSFIALEGAEGYIDTSILKTFPDEEIRKDTADHLMKEGLMSAGEFFDITRQDKGVVLYGVEEDGMYRENVKAFCDVAEARADLVGKVNALLTQLKELEEKIYSSDLRQLNEYALEHRESRMSFSDYWKEIRGYTERLGIGTGEYTEINKLLEALRMEAVIDFEKANAERAALIEAVKDQVT